MQAPNFGNYSQPPPDTRPKFDYNHGIPKIPDFTDFSQPPIRWDEEKVHHPPQTNWNPEEPYSNPEPPRAKNLFIGEHVPFANPEIPLAERLSLFEREMYGEDSFDKGYGAPHYDDDFRRPAPPPPLRRGQGFSYRSRPAYRGRPPYRGRGGPPFRGRGGGMRGGRYFDEPWHGPSDFEMDRRPPGPPNFSRGRDVPFGMNRRRTRDDDDPVRPFKKPRLDPKAKKIAYEAVEGKMPKPENLSNMNWKTIVALHKEIRKEMYSFKVMKYQEKKAKYRSKAFICEEVLETDEATLKRREKQIRYGKVTVGYNCYVEQVPRYQRTFHHPRTPNLHQKCSRRSFDMQIKIWRRRLHIWDPPSGTNAAHDAAEIKSATTFFSIGDKKKNKKKEDYIDLTLSDEDNSDAESSVSLVRETLSESGKIRPRKGFQGTVKKPTTGDLDLTQDLMNFALLSGDNFDDTKDFPDLRSLLGRKNTPRPGQLTRSQKKNFDQLMDDSNAGQASIRVLMDDMGIDDAQTLADIVATAYKNVSERQGEPSGWSSDEEEFEAMDKVLEPKKDQPTLPDFSSQRQPGDGTQDDPETWSDIITNLDKDLEDDDHFVKPAGPMSLMQEAKLKRSSRSRPFQKPMGPPLTSSRKRSKDSFDEITSPKFQPSPKVRRLDPSKTPGTSQRGAPTPDWMKDDTPRLQMDGTPYTPRLVIDCPTPRTPQQTPDNRY